MGVSPMLVISRKRKPLIVPPHEVLWTGGPPAWARRPCHREGHSQPLFPASALHSGRIMNSSVCSRSHTDDVFAAKVPWSQRGPVDPATGAAAPAFSDPPTLALQQQPQGVPGTLEVENYDTGGEGVSFHNPSPSGANPYRQDDVDVEPTSDAG